MNDAQAHRGPDGQGVWLSPDRECGLAHRRLSVLDLSDAGRQPMIDPSGRYVLAFNGEIYNYLELRDELGGDSAFRSGTDSEVLLRAYIRWGPACLDRFIGMFAFAVWDRAERRLFAARDRFGVKPLYYGRLPSGQIAMASEIKALFAAGVAQSPSESAWSLYLTRGVYDQGEGTFWSGVRQVEGGSCLEWRPESGLTERPWYDLASRVRGDDAEGASTESVVEQAAALLEESVRLRFRSDVPVGVCLSGGLDSSLLFGFMRRAGSGEASVPSFTFVCGDDRYDETPWVREMTRGTGHETIFCPLSMEEIPKRAAESAAYQDEPYGGLPTLGMVRVHEEARRRGVTVLLDGNGLDEAWGGYDYYGRAETLDAAAGPVQGSRTRSTRPDCLRDDFREAARPFQPEAPFDDRLRNLQFRDVRQTKIPRAMRFADRASMMMSRELREPFLDHRLVELGLRQPRARKIRGGQGKWLLRETARRLLPNAVREAPKRPVQTPQREWLRGPLRGWADEMIEACLASAAGGWFDAAAARAAWRSYCDEGGDNSFWVWQWISLGLWAERFR